MFSLRLPDALENKSKFKVVSDIEEQTHFSLFGVISTQFLIYEIDSSPFKTNTNATSLNDIEIVIINLC